MNFLGSVVRILGIVWIIFGVLAFISTLVGAGSSPFAGLLSVGLGFGALALGSSLKRHFNAKATVGVDPKGRTASG